MLRYYLTILPIAVAIMACSGESSSTEEQADNAPEQKEETNDEVADKASSTIADTVLVVTSASRHPQDYTGVRWLLSKGKFITQQDDKMVDEGTYTWRDSILTLKSTKFSYPIRYEIHSGVESTFDFKQMATEQMLQVEMNIDL